jgi:hypothetical protein
VMPDYKKIEKAKQLLVDGDDAFSFFTNFLGHLDISDIQIQNYGGNDELNGFLKAFCKAPGFQEKLKSIGVVRDAEKNPKSAFQSVNGLLKKVKLPIPKKPSEITNTKPCVSVYILPDAKTKGMLETICLRSVERDPAMICVETYFKCLKRDTKKLPRNLEKARVQTFLASRKKVPRTLSIASKQNIWPWDSPVFESLKNYVKSL